MLEEKTQPQTVETAETTTWDAAVVGAGYVGVPLAHTLASAGRSVLLIDISQDVVESLNRGESHIVDVPAEQLAPLVREGRIRATTDYNEVRRADAILTELTKLLENIFRSVNIALVNELAQLCERMEIDVWEVIEAAATKPFGFMSFQPGPGLGGHCIPIDPFYLTWKAREYDFSTEFIELAGKVNENMPYYCRSLISQALNHGRKTSLNGAKILVLGVAYKSDIGDTRESPAIKLIELLRRAGAEVAYHDPFVPELPETGLSSVGLDPTAYDCVTIVTAHSSIDYDDLVHRAHVVVDLRNATGEKGRTSEKVWKL